MNFKNFIKKVLPPRIWYFLKENLKKDVDEILIAKNFFKSKSNGVMIDVGACHGSSLFPFLLLNWEIFAFEPDKENHSYLEKYLQKWNLTKKVHLSMSAVSDKKGELKFYNSEDSIGISSLHNFHHSHVFSHKVNTNTLRAIVEENRINKVDFLKIDTEGFDLFVLKGIDFNALKPTFILCEFEDKKTKNLGYKFTDIITLLESNGYKTLISLWKPISKYGAAHEWEKFTTDVNDVNADAWGNILAVSNEDFNSLLKITGLED